MNCQGLWGRLFGHKFNKIYEDKTGGLVKEQLEKLEELFKVSATKACNLAPIDREQIIENTPVKEVKFIGLYCKRCGTLIKESKPIPTSKTLK